MIIILGAMDAEIEQFLGTLRGAERIDSPLGVFWRGTMADRPALIGKSGVGKVLAAMTTQYLIDRYQPEAMLFTGLAGAIDPAFAIGDTVVALDLVQHDMDASGFGFPRGEIPYTGKRFIACDPALLAAAERYRPAQGTLRLGRIGTGDVFVDHRVASASPWLRSELQACAVEMEGAAFALVCQCNAVPFLVARTISDRADGQAGTDYAAFLPRASHNSLEFVLHVLGSLA